MNSIGCMLIIYLQLLPAPVGIYCWPAHSHWYQQSLARWACHRHQLHLYQPENNSPRRQLHVRPHTGTPGCLLLASYFNPSCSECCHFLSCWVFQPLAHRLLFAKITQVCQEPPEQHWKSCQGWDPEAMLDLAAWTALGSQSHPISHSEDKKQRTSLFHSVHSQPLCVTPSSCPPGCMCSAA